MGARRPQAQKSSFTSARARAPEEPTKTRALLAHAPLAACSAFTFAARMSMRSRSMYQFVESSKKFSCLKLSGFSNLHTIVRESGGQLKKINKQFKKNE